MEYIAKHPKVDAERFDSSRPGPMRAFVGAENIKVERDMLSERWYIKVDGYWQHLREGEYIVKWGLDIRVFSVDSFYSIYEKGNIDA